MVHYCPHHHRATYGLLVVGRIIMSQAIVHLGRGSSIVCLVRIDTEGQRVFIPKRVWEISRGKGGIASVTCRGKIYTRFGEIT